MSEHTPRDDGQDEPVGDPRPPSSDGQAFPPPEMPEPIKTANERDPIPAAAPVDPSGDDVPNAPTERP